jgi:hypothetical protein
MGIRDLLFIGLVLGGGAALSANLFPPQTPRKAEPASVPASKAPETRAIVDTVNAEFRALWAERGVSLVSRAPELAILRRLSLGLTGMVPSLEAIRRFEARPEGHRLDHWLTETFADRRHADYLAERLARSYVGTEAGPFLVFRRRRLVSWLSDELMNNRPYDGIVRELISSNGLWTDQPATNFITVTYDPERKLPDAERLAARVARAFLGVRLDCAQCHDHPFQPWKQKDFQGIAAFFGPTRSGFTGIHDGKDVYQMTDRKTNRRVTVEPRVPFAAELLPREGAPRERLARWLTDPRNRYFARATVNRIWALVCGLPLVEPVDDLTGLEEAPPALDRLADDFIAHGYDLRRLIRTIAAMEVFRLDSAAEPEPSEAQEAAWAVFPMTRLRPEQIAGSLIQSASLPTVDRDTHILLRIFRSISENEFIRRYGDTGVDEFDTACGTIPQRLLMLNGKLIEEKTKDAPLNAASQIGAFAPNDRAAVEVAYLTILTRRPTQEESAHFEGRLRGTRGKARTKVMTDLCWTLLNSTEFTWNH